VDELIIVPFTDAVVLLVAVVDLAEVFGERLGSLSDPDPVDRRYRPGSILRDEDGHPTPIKGSATEVEHPDLDVSHPRPNLSFGSVSGAASGSTAWAACAKT